MSIEKNIALEFNEFSKNYTQDMVGCVPHYMHLISSFSRYLPSGFHPESILDLGCGNGNVTEQVIARFPDAHYTLLDASSDMLQLCRHRFDKYSCNYIQTYFQDFTFQEKSFDLVVAGFSLHHCDQQEKKDLFRHIYRSLKSGGIFAYSDLMMSKNNPDHPELIKQWESFVRKHFPDGKKWQWLMEHYQAFDKPDDYIDQLLWIKDAGFEKIDMPFREDYWVYIQAHRKDY